MASCRGQIAQLPPILHRMVPGQACILGVLKVKVEVKVHVIRALLSCHKNRFFSRAYCSIATKLPHNHPRRGLHPGPAQGHGQGQRSRETGTFVMSQKSLVLACKIARSPPNFHTKVPGWACTRGVLKVKVEVKVHVIRALLSYI